MIEYTQKDINRLNSKIFVVTEGTYIGCYECIYAKNKGGYYNTSINGRQIIVHRLMYQIWHPDEDIDDKFIMFIILLYI